MEAIAYELYEPSGKVRLAHRVSDLQTATKRAAQKELEHFAGQVAERRLLLHRLCEANAVDLSAHDGLDQLSQFLLRNAEKGREQDIPAWEPNIPAFWSSVATDIAAELYHRMLTAWPELEWRVFSGPKTMSGRFLPSLGWPDGLATYSFNSAKWVHQAAWGQGPLIHREFGATMADVPNGWTLPNGIDYGNWIPPEWGTTVEIEPLPGEQTRVVHGQDSANEFGRLTITQAAEHPEAWEINFHAAGLLTSVPVRNELQRRIETLLPLVHDISEVHQHLLGTWTYTAPHLIEVREIRRWLDPFAEELAFRQESGEAGIQPSGNQQSDLGRTTKEPLLRQLEKHELDEGETARWIYGSVLGEPWELEFVQQEEGPHLSMSSGLGEQLSEPQMEQYLELLGPALDRISGLSDIDNTKDYLDLYFEPDSVSEDFPHDAIQTIVNVTTRLRAAIDSSDLDA